MLDRIVLETDDATGSAGSAGADGYSPPVSGLVQAVMVEYVGSPPGTTDVTLVDDDDPAGETIVTIANANTDTKLYPRRQAGDNTGSSVSAYVPYAVHGRLKASIAGADPGDAVRLTIWLER